MRKLMVLTAGIALVFVCGSVAVATNFNPPDWTADTWNTSVTSATWTFTTWNSGAPDSYTNPYGTPVASMSGLGTSWQNIVGYSCAGIGYRQGVLQGAVQGNVLSIVMPNQMRSDMCTQLWPTVQVVALDPQFAAKSRAFVTVQGTTPLYPPPTGWSRDANPQELISGAGDGWYISPNPQKLYPNTTGTAQFGFYLAPGPNGEDSGGTGWSNGIPVWIDRIDCYTRNIPIAQVADNAYGVPVGKGIGGWNEQGPPGAYYPEWIPGDLNEDAAVNLGDLNILSDNYGASSAAWYQGDINGDGNVDLGDLNILSNYYGTGGGVAPVPEPSTGALVLLLGAMGLAWRLRRRFV
jgi:hypothetical protein